eukprot:3014991-Rhodomonas_salina.1
MSLTPEQVARIEKREEEGQVGARDGTATARKDLGAPRIMVVDVETHDWIDFPVEEWDTVKGPFGHRCWLRMETMDYPRVIQLAWATYTVEGKKMNERNFYVQHPSVNISEKATKLHHITDDDLLTKGQPLKTVLREFLINVHATEESGGKLVAHNIEFDTTLIHKEMIREAENLRSA